jgi:hypothetical protein
MMLFCIEFGPAFPGVTFLNGSGTSRIFIAGLARIIHEGDGCDASP